MQAEPLLDFYIQISKLEKSGRYCVSAVVTKRGEPNTEPEIAAFTTWDEALAFGRKVVQAVAETFQTRTIN